MGKQRFRAELSKAKTRFSAMAKAAKAADSLAQPLEKNLRDAKRALKKTRRSYKNIRRFFKKACRDRQEAKAAFEKASARLTKLQAKAAKSGLARPAKTKPSRNQRTQAHKGPRIVTTLPMAAVA